jgi:hypothetical protein
VNADDDPWLPTCKPQHVPRTGGCACRRLAREPTGASTPPRRALLACVEETSGGWS